MGDLIPRFAMAAPSVFDYVPLDRLLPDYDDEPEQLDLFPETLPAPAIECPPHRQSCMCLYCAIHRHEHDRPRLPDSIQESLWEAGLD